MLKSIQSQSAVYGAQSSKKQEFTFGEYADRASIEQNMVSNILLIERIALSKVQHSDKE